MKQPTSYLPGISFLFVCLITLMISCSDNGSSPQPVTIEISSISPDSGAVGSEVTIHSPAIDPEHARNQVELNGIDVPILSYGSGSLTFRVPEGATSGPVTLRVNGKVANGPYFKVLTEGPVIEGVTPASGGPGTQVTITGDHFLSPAMMAKAAGDSTASTTSPTEDSLQAGAPEVTLKAKGSPTPSINGLPVSVAFGDQLAPMLSLSNTEIIVEVPEGATGGLITLTVDGQTATSSGFSLISPPVISEVTPTAGPVGTNITITGEHFFPHPDSNRVTVNGRPAPITEADSTSLVATIPEGATTGPVELTTRGREVTGPTFTVTDAPVPQVSISNLSPKSGPVGTEVTITGQNFSANKAENTVTFNGTEATLQSASETELITTVPQSATDGPVKVQVNGQTATGPSFSVTADPDKQLAIEDISPKEGPVSTSVTISGANFSSTASENIVTFNGTEASVQAASTTELTVTVPEGATSGPVKVTVGSQSATGPTFTVTEEPVPQVSISDITPKEGPVGTQVTITGQNFSANKAENTVTFNGTQATLQSASETELMATVPEGATNGPVKVIVGNQTATGPSFSVTADPDKQLAIGDITPKEGPVGTSVTITGANFSSTASENSVTFNGTQATITSASTTELVASVPQGATTGAVKVAVGSQTAEGPTFTVTEEPVPQVTIEDITPKEGPVGTAVTISGQNFSAVNTENAVTFNGTEATLQSATETELVATVPQGATSGPVKVAVGNQTATGPSFSVTTDPDKQLTIEDISPKEGPIGTSVTITGTNFSGTASENTVTFNGTEATVSSASTTELVATVPDGATSGPVQVSVGSQTATGPTFTVGDNTAPTITGEGSFAVEENTTAVATITASDPDGDELAFSLSGGADQGQFSIVESSGELAFTSAPDFENPSDSDADNSYEVEVKVSDGTLSVTKTITVMVTNVNEAPAITSVSSVDVDENTTAVTTITASDPDGDALIYSISGGDDQELFSIDASSGSLAFTGTPDFENPADNSLNNVYEVQVQVTDGWETTTQNLAVTVQDVAGDPSYKAGQIYVDGTFYNPIGHAPNSFAIIYDESIPDGTNLSAADDFSLIFVAPELAANGRSVTLSGPDENSFMIDYVSYGTNTYIQLKFTGGNNGVVDYDNPHDANGDHKYEFIITVDDGTNNPPSQQAFILPIGL